MHVLALVSQAKAELGLWSELGVDEGRRLFWRSFEAGKVWLLSLRLAMNAAAAEEGLFSALPMLHDRLPTPWWECLPHAGLHSHQDSAACAGVRQAADNLGHSSPAAVLLLVI
jgi:hypothetical protein